MNYAPSSDTSLRGMSYEVKNILLGGISSDDSLYSLRLIDRVIKDIYTDLVHQEDKQKERDGEAYDANRIMPFCVQLTENNDFRCVCTTKKGKFMKAKLPKLVQSGGKPYISYLGSTDLSLEFYMTSGISDLNSTYGMIKRPGYFIAGDNAYIALPIDFIGICEVSIMGIPSDPLATTTGLCFDIWSQEWNISQHLRNRTKQLALDFLGNPLNVGRQNRDVRNNSQDGNQFLTIQQ
jgi:hypothetical protein